MHFSEQPPLLWTDTRVHNNRLHLYTLHSWSIQWKHLRIRERIWFCIQARRPDWACKFRSPEIWVTEEALERGQMIRGRPQGKNLKKKLIGMGSGKQLEVKSLKSAKSRTHWEKNGSSVVRNENLKKDTWWAFKEGKIEYHNQVGNEVRQDLKGTGSLGDTASLGGMLSCLLGCLHDFNTVRGRIHMPTISHICHGLGPSCLRLCHVTQSLEISSNSIFE